VKDSPICPARPAASRYEFRDAIFASQLSSTQRAILLALESRYRKPTGCSCVVGLKWLSSAAGVPRRTLIRNLGELEKAGWLVREHRRGRKGRQAESAFHWMIPAPAAAPAPPAAEPVELSIVVELAASRREMVVSRAEEPAPPRAPVASDDPWVDPLASYPVLREAALDGLGPAAVKPGTRTHTALTNKLREFCELIGLRYGHHGDEWLAEVASLAADGLRNGAKAPAPDQRLRYALAGLGIGDGRVLDAEETHERLKAARSRAHKWQRTDLEPITVTFRRMPSVDGDDHLERALAWARDPARGDDEESVRQEFRYFWPHLSQQDNLAVKREWLRACELRRVELAEAA
jgi:hypothetical protein